jgi:hypothetical protein
VNATRYRPHFAYSTRTAYCQVGKIFIATSDSSLLIPDYRLHTKFVAQTNQEIMTSLIFEKLLP